LASPPSTYGLDDEAKLMAPGQAVRLAGAILEASGSFGPEPGQPVIGPAGADPNGFSGIRNGPAPFKDAFHH
jgi:hypothetical protein